MQVPPVPCGSRSRCTPALATAVTAIPDAVFRADERISARLCDRRRAAALGGGHGSRLSRREWRFGPWRCHGRTRPYDRGWHALREFRRRSMGRSAWQRLVGLRSWESLTGSEFGRMGAPETLACPTWSCLPIKRRAAAPSFASRQQLMDTSPEQAITERMCQGTVPSGSGECLLLAPLRHADRLLDCPLVGEDRK
jgi:hypothetical protein